MTIPPNLILGAAGVVSLLFTYWGSRLMAAGTVAIGLGKGVLGLTGENWMRDHAPFIVRFTGRLLAWSGRLLMLAALFIAGCVGYMIGRG